jgi:hypothetical protein
MMDRFRNRVHRLWFHSELSGGWCAVALVRQKGWFRRRGRGVETNVTAKPGSHSSSSGQFWVRALNVDSEMIERIESFKVPEMIERTESIHVTEMIEWIEIQHSNAGDPRW